MNERYDLNFKEQEKKKYIPPCFDNGDHKRPLKNAKSSLK